MLVTRGGVDPELLGHDVERVLATGEALLGQVETVYDLVVDGSHVGVLELGVEEAEVESRIVDNQGMVADEIEEIVCDVGECRSILQHLVGDAVDRDGPRLDLPVAGIDIGVIGATGGAHAIVFNHADLDQAVPLIDVETGGLRVEHVCLCHVFRFPYASGSRRFRVFDVVVVEIRLEYPLHEQRHDGVSDHFLLSRRREGLAVDDDVPFQLACIES